MHIKNIPLQTSCKAPLNAKNSIKMSFQKIILIDKIFGSLCMVALYSPQTQSWHYSPQRQSWIDCTTHLRDKVGLTALLTSETKLALLTSESKLD